LKRIANFLFILFLLVIFVACAKKNISTENQEEDQSTTLQGNESRNYTSSTSTNYNIPTVIYFNPNYPISVSDVPDGMSVTSGNGFVEGFNDGTIAGFIVPIKDFINSYDEISKQQPRIISILASDSVTNVKDYDPSNFVILVIGKNFVNQHTQIIELQESLFNRFKDSSNILPNNLISVDRNISSDILTENRSPLNLFLMQSITNDEVVSLFDNSLVLEPIVIAKVETTVTDTDTTVTEVSTIATEANTTVTNDEPNEPDFIFPDDYDYTSGQKESLPPTIIRDGIRYYGLSVFFFQPNEAIFKDNINRQMQRVVEVIAAKGIVNVHICGYVYNINEYSESSEFAINLSGQRANVLARKLSDSLRNAGLIFDDNAITTEAMGITEYSIGGGDINRCAVIYISDGIEADEK